MFRVLAAKLGPFAIRFFLSFLLLLALWPFISPFYARAMAATGKTVLNAVSLLPPGSRLEARQNRVWVFRPVTRTDGTPAMAGVNVLDEATYFNLVILISLIVATPSLRWWEKGAVSAIGFLILWLLHLADLYVKMKWTAVYPGLRQSGVIPEAASLMVTKIFEWLYAFFSVIGFGLFPILVWIGLLSLWKVRAYAAATDHPPSPGEGKVAADRDREVRAGPSGRIPGER